MQTLQLLTLVLILYILTRIFRLLVIADARETAATRLRIDLQFPDETKMEDVMSQSMTATQKVRATVQAVDSKGRPAKIQAGSVEYKSSDAAVVTVVEDPNNELAADILGAGVGSATVTVTADADLGDGVTEVSGTIDFDIVDPLATGFGITLGPVEEQ